MPSRRKASSVLILWHSHPGINRRTERREACASNSRGLRPGIACQNGTGQAARSNAVAKVVLSPQTLDAALDATEERTDGSEVLGRAPGTLAHVLEANGELLAERERGERSWVGGTGNARNTAGTRGVERRIVSHLHHQGSDRLP